VSMNKESVFRSMDASQGYIQFAILFFLELNRDIVRSFVRLSKE
jgi:hypothetical protein